MLDGDMSIDPELIEDCVYKIGQTEKWAGVCIPVVDTGSSFWVQVIAYERTFYKWSVMEAARFLRRDSVIEVWGYKDIIFYEEFIVPQEIDRLGYNVKIHTKYNIYHDYDDFTFIGNLKKKFYYGKSLNLYRIRMKEMNMDYWEKQTGIIGRYMIFFKNPQFYRYPLFAFGILILKSLEFGAWALGYIHSKLSNK